MALLGLLLLAACGALVVGLLLDTTADTSVQVGLFDETTRSLTTSELFGVGALTGVVAALGLWMLGKGLRRSSAKRSERRAAAAQRREEEESLRQRNQELEARLTQTRAAEQRRNALAVDGQDTPVEAYPDEPVVESPVTTGGRHRKR